MDRTGLRTWMTEHRWTVARLSGVLGVHASTLQRWRAGELPVPKWVPLALRTVEREGGA